MPEQQTIPVPDGSVIITPAQQYAELQEVRRSLDRLVNTVDPALSDIREDVLALHRRIDAQQIEIDANTKWRYMLAGAMTLLTVLVGWGVLNLANLGG